MFSRVLKQRNFLLFRILLIKRSGLFDANWYVKLHGLNLDDHTGAIAHYLANSRTTPLAPHPLFDVAWYRLQNPDCLRWRLTDLEHYLQVGRRRGACPSPIFDHAWYLNQVDDRSATRNDAFGHFLREGAVSGFSSSPLFDNRYYLRHNHDLKNIPTNFLTHFVACGASAGKDPNVFFSSAWYLRQYGSEMDGFADPLGHFVAVGAERGFNPHPAVDLDLFRAHDPEGAGTRINAYVRLVTGKGGAKARNLILDHMRRDGQRANRNGRRDRPLATSRSLDLSSFAGCLAKADFCPEIPAVHTVTSIQTPAQHIELVTFDIWDTVLRRNCHPDEIKLQSARYLYLRAYSELRLAYRDVNILYQARTTAENSAADNDEFEYRFEDAVDRWLETVLVKGTATAKFNLIRNDLIAHEFAAECNSTRLDEAMVDYLRKIRKPAMFVSDFYTSAGFLNDLLDYHGASGWFVRGYASSDTLETKRGGALFDRVLDETGVLPADILHIGDNSHADVLKPREKGITAHHYLVDSEIDRRNWFGEAFYARRRGDHAPHDRRVLALCENVASAISGKDESAKMQQVGARLAPLAISYVLSIIESGIRYHVPTIYYFTREGLFFRDLHDAIVKADPYRTAYPDAEILHVSRRATFAASLNSITPPELMRLWTLYSIQSIGGLATSLNLDPDIVGAMATRAGLDPTAAVRFPWQDKAFVQFLASEPFRSMAETSRVRQRDALVAYLAGKGVTRQATLKIADIGWRGTIQDNLARLLPGTIISGHYLGLHKYLNSQGANVAKTGWIFDEPQGRESGIGDLAPIEMIFNGPSGSVTGYDVGPDGAVPRTEVIPGEEDVVLGPVAALQQGILAAVPVCIGYIRAHGLIAADLQGLAEKLCTSLSKNPPPVVAGVFQRLEHNESFGFGAVDDVSATSALSAALWKPATSSETHAAVSLALSRERWVEGAIRSPEIARWWNNAAPARKASIPSVIASHYSPAIIRARGSTLAVFVPAPIRASGGHRTIFNMVRRLAKVGFNPEIFLESIGAGGDAVEEYLDGTRATIHTHWHTSGPSQVSFATIAHSAMFVSGLANTHHRGYLVQDFEAMFNPMSDHYITAENSFTLGLQHFTIGNWLTHVINGQFGAPSVPAGLGVDTGVYYPLDIENEASAGVLRTGRKPVASASIKAIGDSALPKTRRETAVCFLYQPDKPRRMPTLGIDALRLVKQAKPDCTIYVYGSDIPLHLDFDVINLGLVTDINELNRLYNRCVAGLCISGSNPSRIPYEMMAAGCVPVDLYRYNNLLDHKAGTILLGFQNSRSLSRAILSLLDDARRTATISRNAIKFASTRTLDWEMDVVANNVLAMMDGKLSAMPDLELIYDAKPIVVSNSDREKDIQNIEKYCAHQFSLAAKK